jgi:hypothetical protein
VEFTYRSKGHCHVPAGILSGVSVGDLSKRHGFTNVYFLYSPAFWPPKGVKNGPKINNQNKVIEKVSYYNYASNSVLCSFIQENSRKRDCTVKGFLYMEPGKRESV